LIGQLELFGTDEYPPRRADEIVCGVDEAGRGPLAGPVYAAAVILPYGLRIEGLDDSKKLSDSRRRELSKIIKESAIAFAVASASSAEIDDINILRASMLAMRRAVEALSVRPELVLVDGNRAPDLSFPVQCIVRGDEKCPCISAASILAKVARDDWMIKMDSLYPEYGFARHKGYPTKLHYERLLRYGPAPIHRKTFLRNLSCRAEAPDGI
jgi:ribonuclease HII